MLNLYKKIVIALCLVFVGILSTSTVQAETKIEFKPQVDIPGVNTTQVQPDGSTRAIGEYIKGIYNYGIGIVAILATAVMMFGGFQWIIAGGNAEKIGEAKAWLGAALTGLVLALGSFTILNLINPNLTSLKVSKITPVEEISPLELGCCDWANASCTNNLTKTECEDGSYGEKGTYIGPNTDFKCGITHCINCHSDGTPCGPTTDNKCEDCCNGSHVTFASTYKTKQACGKK